MSELSPDARRLIEATRTVEVPHAADRARLRAALGARLAPPAAVVTKAVGGVALAKLVAGGVILAVLGTAAVREPPTEAPAARAPVAARPGSVDAGPLPSPRATVEPPVLPPAEPARLVPRPAPPHRLERRASPPVAAHTPPAIALPTPVVELATGARLATPTIVAVALAPVAVGTTAPAAPDPMIDELRLLGDAQVALDRHRDDHALRLLDEYAAAHPAGALTVEALGLRVLALCAVGRRDEARATAARLVREAPRSPAAGRTRSSCVSDER